MEQGLERSLQSQAPHYKPSYIKPPISGPLPYQAPHIRPPILNPDDQYEAPC